MSERRLLAPVERTVDVFDRGSSLNFIVIARVHGVLSAEHLHSALRRLELRHPLLRARVERSASGTAFVLGEAHPIPLTTLDGPEEAWRKLAEQALAHRVWNDSGPRAELTWLRHGERDSTLLLLFHHLVSDGSSGIFAMRDLLRLAAHPGLSLEPVPAPAQSNFYPQGHGSLLWKLRTFRVLARARRTPKPQRLRKDPEGPRFFRLARLQIPREESLMLQQRARQDGATVHGVVSAAMAKAVAAQLGPGPVQERIMHPVDLRRYVRACYPKLPAIGEAVGYYVSSLETNHLVDPGQPLGDLAREITAEIRASKARGTPLISGPILGPMLTKRSEGTTGDLPKFRVFAENKVLINTFSQSNLGALEQLGVASEYGALELMDLHFVAAGSVASTLGASVTSFRGALNIGIGWVEPVVPNKIAEQLVARIEHELAEYIGLHSAPGLPSEANAP
ncbi:MAG: condensation domain-containing protein [Myxococcales bacterium]